MSCAPFPNSQEEDPIKALIETGQPVDIGLDGQGNLRLTLGPKGHPVATMSGLPEELFEED